MLKTAEEDKIRSGRGATLGDIAFNDREIEHIQLYVEKRMVSTLQGKGGY